MCEDTKNVETHDPSKNVIEQDKQKWYKNINTKLVLFSISFFILGVFSTFLISNVVHHNNSFYGTNMNRNFDRYDMGRNFNNFENRRFEGPCD